MTCKYYSKDKAGYLNEVGGGVSLPQRLPDNSCKLGRKPDYSGWVKKKCIDTPNNGPCWWWHEENPDSRDTEF